MNLSSHLIKKMPQRIGIVGSGGKTTLIRQLAKELRDKASVLISSTVCMERIPETELDVIDYEYRFDYHWQNPAKGIYLMAYEINPNNSLRGLPSPCLQSLSQAFDVTLIEGDESRQRPLKAWRFDEPKLPEDVDLTIGILDITALGQTISAKTIHNLDVYCDLTGDEVGDVITRQDLLEVILHPQQMFRQISSKTVLFINKVEDPLTKNLAKSLAQDIAHHPQSPQGILMGSLLQGHVEVIKEW